MNVGSSESEDERGADLAGAQIPLVKEENVEQEIEFVEKNPVVKAIVPSMFRATVAPAAAMMAIGCGGPTGPPPTQPTPNIMERLHTVAIRRPVNVWMKEGLLLVVCVVIVVS